MNAGLRLIGYLVVGAGSALDGIAGEHGIELSAGLVVYPGMT